MGQHEEFKPPFLLCEGTQSPLNVKEMGLIEDRGPRSHRVCLDKQMALVTDALWPIAALFSGEIAHRFPQVKHCGAPTAAGTCSPDATRPVLALWPQASPGGQGGCAQFDQPGNPSRR
jgi:hypothetical protein